MEKPNLDMMWETYIRIGIFEEHERSRLFQRYIRVIRTQVSPMISRLKSNKTINWYHFLVHQNPNNKHDPNLYFHIRFDVDEKIKNRNDLELPDYCERDLTRKIDPLHNISGINKSLLTNGIEDAWRIIGEQSNWIMNMLNTHKESVEIPITQFTQFLHFYLNMLGLGGRGILFPGQLFRF